MADAGGTNPRLLVVDDEPDICAIICDVAEGLGLDTYSVCDERAFAGALDSQYSAIVLDLQLQSADGVELLRILKSKDHAIPLILISGLGRGVLHGVRHLAEQSGVPVCGVLEKPLDLEALETLLTQIPLVCPLDEAPKKINQLPLWDLRRAIAGDQLDVAYQPKVDLATGRLCGAEALARWRHPALGPVPPARFIPMAEEHNLIIPLTDRVLTRVLDQQALWKRQGLKISIAVNVSARTMISLNYPDLLAAEIMARGLSPSQVTLEITESAMMEEPFASLDILTRLRIKGFHLSIDDFGTGYSSMLQLHRAPFSELKIDQSFIKSADTDEESRSIVETTIELGHKLGLSVVSEGIETAAVNQLLTDLRCDQGQGFLYSQALPAAAFEEWVARSGRRH